MKNTQGISWKQLLVGMAALTSLVACGGAGDTASDVKVTNGVQLKEADFPSVVLLVKLDRFGESICTGTFVNDSQVVSAGHCIEGLDANPLLFYMKTDKNGRAVPVRALSVHRSENYDITSGVSNLDISVINFPANSAPAISQIAPISPKAGQELTIVGYGNNENTVDSAGLPVGTGAGVKRSGTNEIAQVANGMIAFLGVSGATDGLEAGTIVSSGSGDSGGPMFVNGRLVGITSGGGYMPMDDGQGNTGLAAVSMYVDLNSPMSIALLAKHLKKPAAAPATTAAAVGQ